MTHEGDGTGWEWVSLDPDLNPTPPTQEDITTDLTGEQTPITLTGEHTPINTTGEHTPITSTEHTNEDNLVPTAGQRINHSVEQDDIYNQDTQDLDLLVQEAEHTAFTSLNPGNPRRKSISEHSES